MTELLDPLSRDGPQAALSTAPMRHLLHWRQEVYRLGMSCKHPRPMSLFAHRLSHRETDNEVPALTGPAYSIQKDRQHTGKHRVPDFCLDMNQTSLTFFGAVRTERLYTYLLLHHQRFCTTLDLRPLVLVRAALRFVQEQQARARRECEAEWGSRVDQSVRLYKHSHVQCGMRGGQGFLLYAT